MYDPARCIRCKYGSHDNGYAVCMYIVDTGHRRDCYDGPVCTKFEPWDGSVRRRFGGDYVAEEQEHFEP